MLIKEATYENVMVETRKRVSDDVFGCDCCEKEIKEYPNENSRLELTVFKGNSDDAEHLHFCSWECVLKQLPKIKTDYFISLPFVYFDEKCEDKRSGNELISLLKRLKI